MSKKIGISVIAMLCAMPVMAATPTVRASSVKINNSGTSQPSVATPSVTTSGTDARVGTTKGVGIGRIKGTSGTANTGTTTNNNTTAQVGKDWVDATDAINKQLQELHDTIVMLQDEVESKNAALADTQDLQNKIEKQSAELNSAMATIDDLKNRVSAKEAEIEKLKNDIQDKDVFAQRLQESAVILNMQKKAETLGNDIKRVEVAPIDSASVKEIVNTMGLVTESAADAKVAAVESKVAAVETRVAEEVSADKLEHKLSAKLATFATAEQLNAGLAERATLSDVENKLTNYATLDRMSGDIAAATTENALSQKLVRAGFAKTDDVDSKVATAISSDKITAAIQEKGVLKDYVTSGDLDSRMVRVATRDDLTVAVNPDTLVKNLGNRIVTPTELTSELKNYATTSDVNSGIAALDENELVRRLGDKFVTPTVLRNELTSRKYVSEDTLNNKNFATKTELTNSIATLDGNELATRLGNKFINQERLSQELNSRNFATNTDLDNRITALDVSGLKDSNGRLSGLVKEGDISTDKLVARLQGEFLTKVPDTVVQRTDLFDGNLIKPAVMPPDFSVLRDGLLSSGKLDKDKLRNVVDVDSTATVKLLKEGFISNGQISSDLIAGKLTGKYISSGDSNFTALKGLVSNGAVRKLTANDLSDDFTGGLVTTGNFTTKFDTAFNGKNVATLTNGRLSDSVLPTAVVTTNNLTDSLNNNSAFTTVKTTATNALTAGDLANSSVLTTLRSNLGITSTGVVDVIPADLTTITLPTRVVP